MQIRTTTDPNTRLRRDRKLRSEKGAATSSVSHEGNSFQDILTQVLPATNETTADLHSLWSDLPAKEKLLIEDPSAENLAAYKQLVKDIAHSILKNNMKVAKIKRRVKGNDVELNVLEVIDKRLHQMMMALQSKSNTGFQILRNLDEIRGLLMDLRS